MDNFPFIKIRFVSLTLYPWFCQLQKLCITFVSCVKVFRKKAWTKLLCQNYQQESLNEVLGSLMVGIYHKECGKSCSAIICSVLQLLWINWKLSYHHCSYSPHWKQIFLLILVNDYASNMTLQIKMKMSLLLAVASTLFSFLQLPNCDHTTCSIRTLYSIISVEFCTFSHVA